MTFTATAQSIRSRFTDEWTLVRPGIAIAYDNAAFDPERDARDGNRNPAPWVRLTIIPGEGFQASLGTPRVWRSTGVAVVQIFTPLARGDGAAHGLADDTAAIFRGTRVDGVVFRAPSLTRIGPEGAWYQMNVSTPFHADLAA